MVKNLKIHQKFPGVILFWEAPLRQLSTKLHQILTQEAEIPGESEGGWFFLKSTWGGGQNRQFSAILGVRRMQKS